MKTLYVCGPMSGFPQFNFPAFRDAASFLRRQGYHVISPAETDTPRVRRLAVKSTDGDMDALTASTGESHGDMLGEDVKLIANQADALAVLPGWRKSRGARIETYVAWMYGKPILYFPTLRRVPRHILFSAWTGRGAR